MPTTRRAPRATAPHRRLLAAIVLVIAGCGGPSSDTAPAPASAPLASLAGQRVILLPAPGLDFASDSAPPGTPPLDRAATLAALDSAIERALLARARTVTWVTVDQVARTSRRNATMAPDPYALSSESLRRPSVRIQSSLVEPLASQIRSLTALNDARLVLYPLDLRIERSGGTRRASLRVALVDARLSQVMWIGDVRGEIADASLGPLLANVASRLADLFAAE